MIKMNVERNEMNVEKILKDESLNKSNKMKELFKNGLDVKEISLLMNVRYNFVYNVISNEMLKGNIEDVMKEKKESKKDKIIELKNNGMKIIDICKELKISYNQVWQALNK